MTTAADIIAKGHTAMAELATRPRKPPQTGEEATSSSRKCADGPNPKPHGSAWPIWPSASAT